MSLKINSIVKSIGGGFYLVISHQERSGVAGVLLLEVNPTHFTPVPQAVTVWLPRSEVTPYKPRFRTTLFGEDGNYIRTHETMEEVNKYLKQRLGYVATEANQIHPNQWADEYGRSIYLEELPQIAV